MGELNQLTKNRVAVSNWTDWVIGEQDGLKPARVICIKHDPLFPGVEESFSTHIEVKKEDGSTDLIWGHYDMDLETALKDFYRRLCTTYNRKCHLPARDETTEPNEYEAAYVIPVDPERIKDLLITAFEGGSNDWYFIQDHILPPGKCLTDYEYWHVELPLVDGGSIIITDVEAQEPGDVPGFEPVTLDKAAINKGLNLMAQNHPKHFQDFIDENEDANTADIFLQLCCFGEVVFG